jgi:ribosomal protein S18
MAYFRRRVSPIKPGDKIDYKDVDLLRKFITDRGKILAPPHQRVDRSTAASPDHRH